MTKEELEKEAEEKTKQYMSEHIEKYNSECTKLETDNYNAGREYGYEDGYIAGAEPREKWIEELEKENAGLKRNEFNARSCLELQQSQDKAILNYMGEQLTKAKELIENIIRVTWGEGWNYSLDWKAQAEQFLKEVDSEN